MCAKQRNNEYLPKLLFLSNPEDLLLFHKLCSSCVIIDEIDSQLRELITSRFSNKTLSKEEIEFEIQKLLKGVDKKYFGTWVYYSWSNRLIHTLPEDMFIEVRTNRNLYKITLEEREILSRKHIGIVGLSVGKSAAITMASERCFGYITIADFDTLELSNLNRIRSGIHNIGLLKTVIVAREIAEMDPFLKVRCIHEGLNSNNIDSFFTSNGGLDLVIDECDSLDIKILSRQKAKKYSVPLIMEMSDRGMIDIERYDLDKNYEAFHGVFKGLKLDLESLNSLSNSEKLNYLLKIHPLETLSKRMLFSLNELGKSLKTWPQLASAVSLGGGIICDTSRRILLKQSISSGRYYVDLEKLIL